ncbi:MAG: phosphopantothenoylcysteine decarboxylase domain-containing protein [Endomicrobiales bacterium]
MRLTFLITAGPTREYLDPVRFLSNASSGRMGYALAAAARRRGHRVILVSGPAEPAPPKGITFVPVTSARDMLRKVEENFSAADIVIGAAAVSDYRPGRTQAHKIKKKARSLTLTLTLVQNPDILAWAGKRKKKKILAGFALESDDLLENARKKMSGKNLDLIVANSPSAIGGRSASVWLLRPEGAAVSLKNRAKSFLAERIINETIGIWKNRQAR